MNVKYRTSKINDLICFSYSLTHVELSGLNSSHHTMETTIRKRKNDSMGYFESFQNHAKKKNTSETASESKSNSRNNGAPKEGFPCSECDKVYTEESMLKRHLLTHIGVKPYKCSECDFATGQIGILNKHLQRHPLRKCFVCEECGKMFIDQCTLDRHILSHDEGFMFECWHCGQEFADVCKFNRHLKSHAPAVGQDKTQNENRTSAPKASTTSETNTNIDSGLSKDTNKEPMENTNCLPTENSLSTSEENSNSDTGTLLGYYTEEEVEYEDIKPKIEPEDYDEYGGGGDAGDEDARYNEEMQDAASFENDSSNFEAEQDYDYDGGSNEEETEEKYPIYEIKVKTEVEQEEEEKEQHRESSVIFMQHLLNQQDIKPRVEEFDPKRPKKKRFRCSLCDKAFLHEEALLAHMIKHSGQKPYKCSYCSKSYNTRNDCEQHVRVHTGEKPYQCDHCDKTFARQHSWATHMKLHSGKKDYICEICSKAFATRNYLRLHLLRHKKEENDNLDAANGTIKPRARVPSPIQSFNGQELYKCPHCDKEFPRKQYFMTHQKLHGDKKEYVCEICSKEFATRDYLRLHLLRHKEDRAVFSCDQCGKSFTSLRYLNYHITTHGKEKPYSCEECGKSFSVATYLKKHKLYKHGGHKPYDCNQCTKSFYLQEDLMNHLEEHKNERPIGRRPFKCSECDKAFVQKRTLVNHMQKHHPNPTEEDEDSIHQCGNCTLSFATQDELNTHEILIHTEDKAKVLTRILDKRLRKQKKDPKESTINRLQCGECSMSFRTEEELTTHEWSHIGDKPHKCQMCGKGFSQTSSLEDHYMTDH